jgi:hypothetical protein
MPGILRFLAPATDPTNPKVTYGAGHETDFQDENEPWVIELRREGKAEILEYTPPAATRASREEESKKKG